MKTLFRLATYSWQCWALLAESGQTSMMGIGRALLVPPVSLLLETGRARESMAMVRKKSISFFLAAWNVSGYLPAPSAITNW